MKIRFYDKFIQKTMTFQKVLDVHERLARQSSQDYDENLSENEKVIVRDMCNVHLKMNFCLSLNST
uniref:Uncharacterized protein n=1 Tax=Seriola dumerili TaxID=41447 RepID=A0A3B4VI98_SERDU